MSQFVTREGHGMHVHVLPTKKYKMTTIVVDLVQEIRAETVTGMALIPYVLMRGTKQHPTAEKLQLALDDLYGATLHTAILKKGDRQVIDFTMSVPNEKFLNTEENLFEKALEIIAGVFIDPVTENGGFSPEYVNAEKEQQKKRMAAIIDDKNSYARERCLEEMTKGQPFSLPRLGFENELETITPQELYSLYQKVIKTAPTQVYVIGDVEPEQVFEQIFRALGFERTVQDLFAPSQRAHEKREVKRVVDHMDVKQGKLNVGFWTNLDYDSDDYCAMLMFNGIYGTFPHSKLFLNVREKNSLAYYASSRHDGLKGILYVQSGVEFANMEKALAIIVEQLEEMKKGNITDQELDFTLKGYINAFKTSLDQPTTLADSHLNGLVGGKMRSHEELIEQLQKVTKDDIVRVAQGVQLDTVYMLRDKEGESHA
ncbi:insulinase family protein [Tumebacillus sp. ITR2]|uniref:Insulinase family protein n=1 Tax=Tumebacillus amylolyticus TaxID=2801339 RepID=A0ABS1J8R6_9BACL|nr:pitrilysin family protein [Tumebacillus amylolyticus]MBL0386595.1 insulinase family protein [Tumebacillus amylolyticus]